MPDRDWKLATYGEAWQHGETLVAGIGQGFILATPLQLAVMAARLANGGIAVRASPGRPALVPPRRTKLPVFRRSDIPEEHAQARAGKGWTRVTNEPRGTAYRRRITEPGMAIGRQDRHRAGPPHHHEPSGWPA